MWTALRYDMHQYQQEISRHLDYPDHTLILSPRRSGKSTSLFDRFLSETDSAMFFVNHLNAKHFMRQARERARDWHTQHMYSMSSADRARGRHYNTIYVDEMLWGCNGRASEIERFLEIVLPCCDRIVAASTPNGTFDVTFPNTVNIQEVLDGRSFVPVRRTRDYLPEELFSI